ncbi:MAG TPA: alanine--glyoxylate aminotransferase family protein [Chloroflexi bacterium]|nr:alanine--glyoxylate aminotransferase family protein [Chloroflexota bacterium]
MAYLFVPGPVDVDPGVAQAQARPMIPHRSKEFEEIFHRAANKSKALFGTQYRVFISTSSGTGLHEAAVRNLSKERILACVNGAFGKRWFDVAVTNGKAADKLDVEWGQPVTAEIVTEALEKGHYDLVTVVQNETSTGLMNPVDEIAAAVREVSPDTIVAVDAVSSLSGAPMKMDEWGIDFVLTSSQKALALPPGISLAAVSDRALERAESVPNRGWYFDLLRLEKPRIKNSPPATPAVALVYALDVQMDRILAEGVEARWERHLAMSERVHQWALERGFGLFAAEGYRSYTVTTVANTHKIDIGDLNAFLLQRGMRLANGYGDLKNKTFRIAHMGEVHMEDLNTLLAAIDDYMAQ